MAIEGLVTVKSAFGPEETMKRLEAEVKAKGLTVFAHVDHAAGVGPYPARGRSRGKFCTSGKQSASRTRFINPTCGIYRLMGLAG